MSKASTCGGSMKKKAESDTIEVIAKLTGDPAAPDAILITQRCDGKFLKGLPGNGAKYQALAGALVRYEPPPAPQGVKLVRISEEAYLRLKGLRRSGENVTLALERLIYQQEPGNKA